MTTMGKSLVIEPVSSVLPLSLCWKGKANIASIRVCLVIQLLLAVQKPIEAFSPPAQQHLQQNKYHRCSFLLRMTTGSKFIPVDDDDDNVDTDGDARHGDDDASSSNRKPSIVSRRNALRNAAVISAAAFTPVSTTAVITANAETGEDRASTATATATSAVVDLDCLQDLPPLIGDDGDDYIRIYLCRHGQTENNRLRIVQGARVDPPINQNGIAQATNLGRALGRRRQSQQQQQQQKSDELLFFSSSLLRAKMTAELAAAAAASTSTSTSAMTNTNSVRELASLAEIDFGPMAEGQPISKVKQNMEISYTKWSMGNVDYRPDGGGDNGREVLTRASEALVTLVQEANAAGVSEVVAVTHSAYLRVLIGMVLNEPLLKSSLRKIRNGSVTVVDVPNNIGTTNNTTRNNNNNNNMQQLGTKPILLGGWFSQKPLDFNLAIPRCKTIRINEVRHLPVDAI